ncbi:trace amine-associated receptor 13c-like [Silurus meridionalis]|uniref:trace amine-associated receptor 13c-like n=1 Tax=Silurus meridionalis TaxID=175797 RepID=UPI001EEBFE5B|nr:trace amine-associated receptor 13c-like [Silurus meridionalis]
MNVTELNLSDPCAYFSCPGRSVSLAVYILLYVCGAAVILLTVCGNLLVIISVLHFKQLHTPTNTLVLSLAVSDFFIGALMLPALLMWTIESCWILGRVLCTCVWLIAGVLMSLSIYTVALIAVDRYLALSNPFVYTDKISWRTMCAVVYANWCLCVACNVTFYYFNGNFTDFLICPGQCYYFVKDFWSALDLAYSFIFPLSVIIILYTRVFLIAKKHATAIRELNNHTRPQTQKITSHSMKSERKAAKILGILVAVFLLCLLPYFLCSILGYLITLPVGTFRRVMILVFLNSTLNPFIYALFYPWFRKCSKLIVTLQIFQPDSALINILS